MSLAATPLGWRLQAACRDPQRHQRALLAKLLARHGTTAFGRAHGLSPRMTWADFQRAVPIRRYAELEPWIARSVAGEPAVLTTDRARWFVRSSGTTGTPKLVPVTREGVRAFQRVRDLWLLRTLELYPQLATGTLLALASPADEEPLRGGGVALRQTSTSWVPERGRLAGLRIAVAPHRPGLDPEQRRRHVLVHSLEQRVSAFVATNPSALVVLLDDLLRFAGELASALAARPGASDGAAALRAIAARGAGTARDVWPGLALLACWTEGPAALHVPRLAELSGAVPLRDIGLACSEGYFAMPVDRPARAVLAIADYGIELVAPEGTPGEPLPWRELSRGDLVRLVVTTPSGLWRYDTEDIVEVVGWLEQVPTVAFRRRCGAVVSIAGEKVTEAQVVQAMTEVAAARQLRLEDFVCWVAWPAGDAPHYRFRIEAEGHGSELAALGGALDAALGRLNVEYRAARRGGRLGAAVAELAAPGMLRQRLGALAAAGAPWAEAKERHLLRALPARS